MGGPHGSLSIVLERLMERHVLLCSVHKAPLHGAQILHKEFPGLSVDYHEHHPGTRFDLALSSANCMQENPIDHFATIYSSVASVGMQPRVN